MDLDAYVAEHDGEWRRLEQLSRTGRLAPAETDEMLMLYQRASTHLSVVRSRMPDPLVVARLSGLVLMARSSITGTGDLARRRFLRFFTHTFPLACYQARYWWAGTAFGFVVVVAVLIGYVAANPQVQAQLWSPQEIQSLVNHSFADYYSEYRNENFALRVWTNNAQIAAIALVGGALILPTLWVLWQNALNLGLTGGVMVGNGRADLFFGLIAPHGLLELGAVLLAAAVGLRIGWSWIVPAAGYSRSRSLAAAGRSGIMVALGLVAVLAVAGLIEGFVTPNLPGLVAIPIGAFALSGFLVYVVMRGRAAIAEGYDADPDAERRAVGSG
ncbi:putative membrane protein SpoIIM required for sporulation [Stackebrandtia albiflava]|uniref:Putative membrane protein SpoIIM required for sporulation n=1 Tax=Stackebrandtia albiflava TaxID=406432 RepID=A0A562V4I1_9ACTN|nr:stage II sporulation protein M [Stackebrandtia albiflava]TWJ12801.1 putative membrane protein SpoIIM required for sporulation [Stackebrandtia albiflava]